MRKILLVAVLVIVSMIELKAQSYEYKVITSVESIVPMGIGRSRIISSNEERNFQDFTSIRTAENKK